MRDLEKSYRPYFISGNLTGHIYLDLLGNAIYPNLVQVLENEEGHQTLILQQDGIQSVRQILDVPHGWIGRKEHIEWHPDQLIWLHWTIFYGVN